MSQSGSFTNMLVRLREGDEEAVCKLWDRFFEPLKQLANQRLNLKNRKSIDEEDLALSAINAFCKCVQTDRYKFGNSDDIWNLLVCITERKAIDHLRRENAQKRGPGEVSAEEWGRAVDKTVGGISQVTDGELDHEFAIEFFDQLNSLVQKLGTPELVQIINRKIEGYTNSEIAQEMDISVSTVERKLRLARDIWREADCE